MKKISLLFLLLGKNIMMTLLIIVQLAISITLSNTMVTKYNTINGKINLFSSFVDDNLYYFMPIYHLIGSDKVSLQTLNENPNIDKIINSTYYDCAPINMIGYSGDFFDVYKPELSKGEWFDTYSDSDNTIPGVLTKESTLANVGDIIELKCQHTGSVVKIKVIGLQKYPYLFSFNVGGSGIAASDVIMENQIPNLVVKESDFIGSGFLSNPSISMMLYTNGDITDDLGNLGSLVNSNSVLEKGIKETDKTLASLLPYTIFASLVSVVGVLGCIIISLNKNIKMFGILSCVGYSKKECVKIMIYYLLALVAFALILSSLFTIIIHSNSAFSSMLGQRFDIYNILILGVHILMVLSTIIYPISIFKRNSEVQLMKSIGG